MQGLAPIVKEMEIREFKAWATTASGLERHEAAVEQPFTELEQLRREISARKLNDSPRTRGQPLRSHNGATKILPETPRSL